MMIVEYTPDEPLTLLNEERYKYYQKCEEKSRLTEKQIHNEALELFKKWAEKTNFNVELRMVSLRSTFHSKYAFSTKWTEDNWINSDKLKDPVFKFEMALNDAVNKYVSSAYEDHREELKKVFIDKNNKWNKEYRLWRKLAVWSLIVNICLTLIIILLIVL